MEKLKNEKSFLKKWQTKIPMKTYDTLTLSLYEKTLSFERKSSQRMPFRSITNHPFEEEKKKITERPPIDTKKPLYIPRLPKKTSTRSYSSIYRFERTSLDIYENKEAPISLRSNCTWICDMLASMEDYWKYMFITGRTNLALGQKAILNSFLQVCFWSIFKKHAPYSSNSNAELRRIMKTLVLQNICNIMRRMQCDPQCFVIALIYIEQFLNRIKPIMDMSQSRKFFAICLMLATKFWEDDYLRNYTYLEKMKIPKISLNEFNQLERIVLKGLNYELFISKDYFRKFIRRNARELEEEIKNNLDYTFRKFIKT